MAAFSAALAPLPIRRRMRQRMRLIDVELVREPHHISLVGRLERQEFAPTSDLFFRFPPSVDPLVGVSGDPFLAALLIPAMVAGASLEIEAPVSKRLLRRTVQVQDVLTAWYPKLHRIEVTAPVRPDGPHRPDAARGVGAFFSGGIDSCYTLVKSHLGFRSVADPISHLIFVKGFDARLSEAEGLAESERHLGELAAEYNRTLIVVETNLRDVAQAPWGEMHHGGALAAVAHCLGRGLHTVLIPGSGGYDEVAIPWGSHPLLDELWSTESVQLLHDGAEASRIDKLAALVRHAPTLVDRLRVCYEGSYGGPRNCGRCTKCVRVMVMLRALGHLGSTSSFPGKLPANYARAFPALDRGLLPHVVDYARIRGDRQLVRSLQRRVRQLIWQTELPRLIRAHPIGAWVLDGRAALLKWWRALTTVSPSLPP